MDYFQLISTTIKSLLIGLNIPVATIEELNKKAAKIILENTFQKLKPSLPSTAIEKLNILLNTPQSDPSLLADLQKQINTPTILKKYYTILYSEINDYFLSLINHYFGNDPQQKAKAVKEFKDQLSQFLAESRL